MHKSSSYLCAVFAVDAAYWRVIITVLGLPVILCRSGGMQSEKGEKARTGGRGGGGRGCWLRTGEGAGSSSSSSSTKKIYLVIT